PGAARRACRRRALRDAARRSDDAPDVLDARQALRARGRRERAAVAAHAAARLRDAPVESRRRPARRADAARARRHLDDADLYARRARAAEDPARGASPARLTGRHSGKLLSINENENGSY